MKDPVYIGIENEFQLMNGSKRKDFSLNDFMKKYDRLVFKKSDDAIRTRVGSAIYSDGGEPEVNIPPVELKKGAITHAADLLYLSRKELVNMIEPFNQFSLIGYSTHWNISDSRVKEVENDAIMRSLAIPYSLLCLTPISLGVRICRKDKERLEMRGDFILEEDQIKAMLNFFCGTITQFEDNAAEVPFSLDQETSGNLVKDGRYTKIRAYLQKQQKFREIYAQDYLEVYYDFFKKGIQAISTDDELRNLEDFVFNRKPLEVDKFKKYTFQSFFKNVGYLRYNEAFIIPISDFEKDREIPTTLAKGFARFANSRYHDADHIDKEKFPFEVLDLTWDSAKFLDDDGKEYCILGKENIERLEKLISACTENEREEIIKKFAMLYDLMADYTSIDDLIKDTNLSKHLIKTLKKEHKEIKSFLNKGYDIESKLEEFDKRKPTYNIKEDNSYDFPRFLLSPIITNFSFKLLLLAPLFAALLAIGYPIYKTVKANREISRLERNYTQTIKSNDLKTINDNTKINLDETKNDN